MASKIRNQLKGVYAFEMRKLDKARFLRFIFSRTLGFEIRPDSRIKETGDH